MNGIGSDTSGWQAMWCFWIAAGAAFAASLTESAVLAAVALGALVVGVVVGLVVD